MLAEPIYDNLTAAREVRDVAGTPDLTGVQKKCLQHHLTVPQGYPRDHCLPKIIRIDGDTPASLIIEYGVGVSKEKTYKINKIDSDFFFEGSPDGSFTKKRNKE